LSHQPHVILNQARMNSLLLDTMRRFNGQEVDYGFKVKSVEVDSELVKDPAAYPVTVVTEKDGKDEVFQAKYALVSFPHLFYLRLSLIFLGLRWGTFSCQEESWL